jgi:hypothetical protein
MLSAFAEFETNLRKERQLEGIAKAAGVYIDQDFAVLSVGLYLLYLDLVLVLAILFILDRRIGRLVLNRLVWLAFGRSFRLGILRGVFRLPGFGRIGRVSVGEPPNHLDNCHLVA